MDTYSKNGDKPETSFPRISKPLELLRASYDCVVVGSGYGGGVAASRIARAGESVCVLERGKEKWPGEYPTTLKDATTQFHFSGGTRDVISDSMTDNHDQTGMYHLVSGNRQSAFLCNGLGGGSLINANVFLEADPKTLEMEVWPPEIRNNPSCLEKYYDQVRDVLEPETYPDDWPSLKRTEVFQHQAKLLGFEDRFYKVPQTTRFRDGPNSCGVNMSASTLTGLDVMGINDGSKTTTLVTYLADAWNWGADLFCQCEVRYITKAPDHMDGYIIYFAWHSHNRGRFHDSIYTDLMWVHARKAVFLGAGSIGTTEILLRSNANGLAMSDLVGRGMSGNGDMLAFGYDCDFEVNGIGREHPSPDKIPGPSINAVIDNRATHDTLGGFVIQEGVIPQSLSPLLQVKLNLPRNDNLSNQTLFVRVTKQIASWKSMLLHPCGQTGSMQKTQTFLVMSHDDGRVSLRLQEDRLVLEDAGIGQDERVKRLSQILERATNAVGGSLVENPYQSLNQKQVTVHPLGGAGMSRENHSRSGVTNHLGEVFAGRDTSKTHRGLIVTDGALIPSALGVNPFATISALAERAVAEYAKSNNLFSSREPNGALDLFGRPAHGSERLTDEGSSRIDLIDNTARLMQSTHNSVNFTEFFTGQICSTSKMNGYQPNEYNMHYGMDKNGEDAARLFLSASVFKTSLDDETRPRGVLTGSFVCPNLVGSPFMVLQGDLDFFKESGTISGTKTLEYRFEMIGVNQRRLQFHGHKIIDSSTNFDPHRLWSSTTTLYIRITETVFFRESLAKLDKADVEYRDTVATGIMHVRLDDFAREVLTLRPIGKYLLDKIANAVGFLGYFAHQILSSFCIPLAPLQYPTKAVRGFINYTPPTTSYVIRASDGLLSRMYMWQPEPKAVATDAAGKPVKMENLFMVPGVGVDQDIFATPTIPFNAINYFTRAGYRVFVTVHRIGKLERLTGQWTTFDARLDIKASLEQIRGLTGKQKVYTIAHCMGSVALASGLLDGTIPADWILGLTCSQVFMDLVWSPLNVIKAAVGLDRVYEVIGGDWMSCRTSRHDALLQRMLNQLLRLHPEKRSEMCNSASCHRTTLLFGRCWNHWNLNEATHSHIDHFFNGASMTLMRFLAGMGRQGSVRTNGPTYDNLTTNNNMQRLRGIPLFIFVGNDNAVLSTKAAHETFERLQEVLGPASGEKNSQYRKRVIPGYGHLDCWMGRNAWRDVFPPILEEMDRVVRGENHCFFPPNDRFQAIVASGGV